MNQVDEFILMQDFLSSFDTRVVPHTQPLNDSQRKLLDRIARGEASSAERDKALPLLLKDPRALEYLAHQLKQS
jgi:hypothetical protein